MLNSCLITKLLKCESGILKMGGFCFIKYLAWGESVTNGATLSSFHSHHVLYKPKLSFFPDYLVSVGAKLPAKPGAKEDVKPPKTTKTTNLPKTTKTTEPNKNNKYTP